MTKAKVTRTSSDSATCEPIVLRDGEATRLVFSPVIVKNQRDRLRPVKGELLWQRRAKGDEWEDEASLKLTTMQAGSGVKLALSTDELHLVTLTVRGLYGFYWKNGLPHDDMTHERLDARVPEVDQFEIVAEEACSADLSEVSATTCCAVRWLPTQGRGDTGRAGRSTLIVAATRSQRRRFVIDYPFQRSVLGVTRW